MKGVSILFIALHFPFLEYYTLINLIRTGIYFDLLRPWGGDSAALLPSELQEYLTNDNETYRVYSTSKNIFSYVNNTG